MQQITSVADAPRVLEERWSSRRALHRLDLQHMREVMDYLGNPQDQVKAIHIAGTSGKTSTAYYAAALLHAAGKKVGLHVSPHVSLLNERIQVNMQPLDEPTFCSELNTFAELIEQSGLEPNYFEVLYAFAFWEFARQRVEYMVVEVGIGGLLDSTNVMTRADKVCVLTDIGFDHTKLLGSTLGEIAAQKAGIILLHNAVFCWQQPAEVMQVFEQTAKRRQADLHVLDQGTLPDAYAFLPLFQRRNYELALQTVQYVLQRDGGRLSEHAKELAAHVRIPARMETFRKNGKTIIVDGAHNQQKLTALAESVRAQYPGKQVAVLAAFTKGDYRVEQSVAAIVALADYLILTSFAITRTPPRPSIDPARPAAICDKLGYTPYEVIVDLPQAWQAVLARPESVIVVTGSFFFAQHIRALLL